MMFYVTMIPVLILSALMIGSLRRLEKHDRVLYRFCEVRRQLMRLLRDSAHELSREDYAVVRIMLDIVGGNIHDYHETKQQLLNGRQFLRRLRRYSTTVGAVHELEAADPRVRKIQTEFGRTILFGFFQYTPLLRSEIIARLLVASASLFARFGWHQMKNLAAALRIARDTTARQGRDFDYAAPAH